MIRIFEWNAFFLTLISMALYALPPVVYFWDTQYIFCYLFANKIFFLQTLVEIIHGFLGPLGPPYKQSKVNKITKGTWSSFLKEPVI